MSENILKDIQKTIDHTISNGMPLDLFIVIEAKYPKALKFINDGKGSIESLIPLFFDKSIDQSSLEDVCKCNLNFVKNAYDYANCMVPDSAVRVLLASKDDAIYVKLSGNPCLTVMQLKLLVDANIPIIDEEISKNVNVCVLPVKYRSILISRNTNKNMAVCKRILATSMINKNINQAIDDKSKGSSDVKYIVARRIDLNRSQTIKLLKYKPTNVGGFFG